MNTDMDIDINTMTDTITCRLVEARADLGITQKELASATGISLKTIANIESKQHIPSLLYAMRIADFFTNRQQACSAIILVFSRLTLKEMI